MTVVPDQMVDFDRLFASDELTIRCPYAVRPHAPVEWVNAIQAFVVSGADACAEVLKHPEVYSSANVEGAHTERIHTEVLRRSAADPRMADLRARGYGTIETLRVLLNADPPVHTRQRKLISRAFSARRVAGMEAFIRRTAQMLANDLVDGQADLMAQLAIPLPLIVIAEALGVDPGDRGLFHTWSDAFLLATGNLDPSEGEFDEMVETRIGFDRYMISIIDERLRSPRDDLMQDLVDATTAGESPLSLDELLWILKVLLVGGNETTAKQLGSAFLVLLEQPELQERLRGNPVAIARFTDESLRMEGSLQGFYRLVTADTELSGVAIPAGSNVWVAATLANRDPALFACPADLDLDRPAGGRHLTFSVGPHFCAGSALARAEIRICLEIALERMPDLRFAPGIRSRFDIPYTPSYILHGPLALPVQFRPAVAASR